MVLAPEAELRLNCVETCKVLSVVFAAEDRLHEWAPASFPTLTLT